MSSLSPDLTLSERPISATFPQAVWVPAEKVSKEIENGELLGEGVSGQVWLVKSWGIRTGFSASGQKALLDCAYDVVVKVMKPDPGPRSGMTSAEAQQRALNREFNVALEVAKLGLPHVVKLHAYTNRAQAPPDAAPAQATYALVMEHCELGSLKDLMRKLTWRNPAFNVAALGSLEKVALEWQRLVLELSAINHAGIVLQVLLAFFISLAGCPFNPLMLHGLPKRETAQQADLRQLLVDTVVLGQCMMKLSPEFNIVPELEADSLVWYLGAWILLLFTLDSPDMPEGYHLDHAEVASLLGVWHIVALEVKDEQLHWMALEYATFSSPFAREDWRDPLFKKHFGEDNLVPEIMMRIDSYASHFYKLCSVSASRYTDYFLLQEESLLARSGGVLPGFAPEVAQVPARPLKRRRVGGRGSSPVEPAAAAHHRASLERQAASRQKDTKDQGAGQAPPQQAAEEPAKARLAVKKRRAADLYTGMPGLATLGGDKERVLDGGTDGTVQPAEAHAARSSAEVHQVAGREQQHKAVGAGGYAGAAAVAAPRVPQEDGQEEPDSLRSQQHALSGCPASRFKATECNAGRL
ncbi:hypothetical protein N2152v2_010747 [Parachlorella kessleri]